MSLTTKDLAAIEKLTHQAVREETDNRFAEFEKRIVKTMSQVVHDETDDRFATLEKRIDLLPTKDEFFAKEDELLTELVAIRQEQTTLSYRVSQHPDEINQLQKICATGK